MRCSAPSGLPKDCLAKSKSPPPLPPHPIAVVQTLGKSQYLLSRKSSSLLPCKASDWSLTQCSFVVKVRLCGWPRGDSSALWLRVWHTAAKPLLVDPTSCRFSLNSRGSIPREPGLVCDIFQDQMRLRATASGFNIACSQSDRSAPTTRSKAVET